MSAEGIEAANDSTEEIATLVDELALLRQMPSNLDPEPMNQMMVEAVSGLIEKRQGELERAQRARE